MDYTGVPFDGLVTIIIPYQWTVVPEDREGPQDFSGSQLSTEDYSSPAISWTSIFYSQRLVTLRFVPV